MSTIKVTVALNSMGQVAAASRHAAHSEVASGMVADLGQTLVEIEVPANVAEMEADEFLSHLAEQASVKAATTHLTAAPDSSQQITSGTV